MKLVGKRVKRNDTNWCFGEQDIDPLTHKKSIGTIKKELGYINGNTWVRVVWGSNEKYLSYPTTHLKILGMFPEDYEV